MFAEMEQRLNVNRKPEDSFFYYHSCDDRIVLSHALFWVMTQNIRGHVAKEKYFLLLRQYQEEMLSAFLTESDEFPELLHYCNVMYETLPIKRSIWPSYRQRCPQIGSNCNRSRRIWRRYARGTMLRSFG